MPARYWIESGEAEGKKAVIVGFRRHTEPDRFKLNPLHQMPGLNT
jgi:hypothetical protein